MQIHKIVLGTIVGATKVNHNILYQSYWLLNCDSNLMLFFRIYLLLEQHVLVRQGQCSVFDQNEKTIKSILKGPFCLCDCCCFENANMKRIYCNYIEGEAT